MTNIRSFEIGENLLGKLLPSQTEFISSPERYSFIAGGFRSGKSHSMCVKGLILSAAIPNNVGMLLCYRGTDVEARLKPLLDQIIPKSWIKAYHVKNRTYTLRNNSLIILNHLHDANASSQTAIKTRRIGMNLGWFGIDQIEECEKHHWDAMISRLSLPIAPRKFGFATLNPAGRDWIWEKAFRGMREWPKDKESGRTMALPGGEFYQAMRPEKNVVGIAINSEENRVSNGGFVDDEYFDSLLEQYGEDWVQRYVYCSFADFKGKLFKDYEAGIVDDNFSSVHNVEPFTIPRHWECVVGIDVGGDSPWAIVPNYIDEYGNLIVAPSYHDRGGKILPVINWIKRNIPWNENRCKFIIDPENLPVRAEFAEHGIYCQTAQKAINPGLLRMEGYFHVNERRSLPQWYLDTQPPRKIEKFRAKGSPRIFVFKNDEVWRREHDTAKWDPNKVDVMYKTATARFDSVEAQRYIIMDAPEPSKAALDNTRYEKIESADPMAAREWRSFDKRLAAIQSKIKGNRKGLLQSVEEDEDGYDFGEQLAKIEETDEDF